MYPDPVSSPCSTVLGTPPIWSGGNGGLTMVYSRSSPWSADATSTGTIDVITTSAADTHTRERVTTTPLSDRPRALYRGLAATGSPVAFFNQVLTVDDDVEADAVVEAAALADDAGLAWMLHLRDGVDDELVPTVHTCGLQEAEGYPAMVLFALPEQVPDVPGLRVERIQDVPASSRSPTCTRVAGPSSAGTVAESGVRPVSDSVVPPRPGWRQAT